jgi:hypothetical protein
METWIKIDPHVHSKGVSLCSRLTCEEIIDSKRALGYDGAVLTNHCQRWYYPAEEHKYFIERVIEEFSRGKAYADKVGFRWYLGIEVSLDDPHYADWLLYGVTEEFLRATPCLYNLSQKELFDLCEEWGIVLIQAHPFRQSPCDPRYMHGVERNCSSGDLDKTELVEEFAKQHGLLVTCGTDYHFTENNYFGGIFVPKSCTTAKELAEYLRRAGEVTVFANKEKTTYKTEVFSGK